MAGTTHMLTRMLLLLSLIRTSVNGKNGLLFRERVYDIKFPCEEDFEEVCFYMWQIGRNRTSEYVAIVSNGEIQKAVSEDKKCNLQIKDLTAEDMGHHHCQRRTNALSPNSTAPELNLMPGKAVSLQCVLLTYVEQGHCYTQQQQPVSLMWVDEAGTVMKDDSQHQIKHHSSCKITLAVSLQRTEKKKFRCQAIVAEQTLNSMELTVGASGLRRSGRRVNIEPAHQGGNQSVVGGAVGAVGCVVFTIVVAVLVMKKRRTNINLHDEPNSVQSCTNNVVSTEDVIYADINFPVGYDRVWIHEYESTEYACVQYISPAVQNTNNSSPL